jgi:hypothetical protein
MSTMADRQCLLLQADYKAALSEKRQLMQEIGAHEMVSQFDALLGRLQKSSPEGEDISISYLNGVADELKAAMADLGVSAERLNSFRVVTTLREAVSAQMTPFDDGSGLVIVDDGVFAVCSAYSYYATLRTTRWASLQNLRESRKSGMYGNAGVLANALRYVTTHQRLLGIVTQLDVRLGPRGVLTAGWLTHCAHRFIIAHEVAHHVLGHSSAVNSFIPGEHVPPCSDSEQQERDADRLAFQATRRASVMGSGRLPARMYEDMNEMGTMIAILALYLAEQAFFVRRGCTHPPASTRAAWLLDELKGGKRRAMQTMLRIPIEATETAAEISEGAHPFSWEALRSTPVRSHMPQSHLEAISWLDALQCWSEPEHVDLLVNPNRDSARWLGEGALLAVEGNAAGALRQWGVSEIDIDRLCDPRRALTFFKLKEDLARSFTRQGIGDDLVLPYSVAAAMLAAPRLRV